MCVLNCCSQNGYKVLKSLIAVFCRTLTTQVQKCWPVVIHKYVPVSFLNMNFRLSLHKLSYSDTVRGGDSSVIPVEAMMLTDGFSAT